MNVSPRGLEDIAEISGAHTFRPSYHVYFFIDSSSRPNKTELS